MNDALSNFQIESLLGKGSIPIVYKELRKYSTIEDLLPNDGSFKIILLNDSPNSGHWVCITRNKDTYNYFNSYGQSFNQDLYVIPATIRRILGSYDNYLNDLLKDKKVVYNKVKLQHDKSAVCGRYVVLFIIMNTKMGYSMNQFINYLKEHKKETGEPYDKLILVLTQSFNKRINKDEPHEIKLSFTQ
jgi:hypothetical protein